MAKRAALRNGWQQAELILYGKKFTKTLKTSLASYPVVGGNIRVVLVREDSTCRAFFCTDPTATMEKILRAVTDQRIAAHWLPREKMGKSQYSNLSPLYCPFIGTH